MHSSQERWGNSFSRGYHPSSESYTHRDIFRPVLVSVPLPGSNGAPAPADFRSLSGAPRCGYSGCPAVGSGLHNCTTMYTAVMLMSASRAGQAPCFDLQPAERIYEFLISHLPSRPLYIRSLPISPCSRATASSSLITAVILESFRSSAARSASAALEATRLISTLREVRLL